MIYVKIEFLWKLLSLSLPTSNVLFRTVIFFNLFIYCQNEEVYFDLDQFKTANTIIKKPVIN